MRYEVFLTQSAERDLASIHDYIADHDSPKKAARLLEDLQALIERLAQLPERGSVPRELLDLGVRDYRQVMFNPYRLIYRRFETRVIIYLIADGRRDMQTLLMHRLLDSN